jgi:disulfide oxidoreductase YuzD
MITYDIKEWMSEYSLKRDFPERPYKYHNYPDGQWGVHSYLVSRDGAKRILDEFAYGYADVHRGVKQFSPDWTISKIGNRALVYPMFSVEDGSDSYEHYGHDGQYAFHMETFKHNYKEGEFI